MDTKGIYTASAERYDNAERLYAHCGRSGVMLPKVSLGFWHNFGGVDPYERSRAITHYAFDHGITHFDLANNYGPPYGSAEETMGRLMDDDFRPYRDELFISTKAGYDMWPGPYGNWGSRKYLMASLDQSLRRMHLDYVDLFYSHRFDPETPVEETLQALVDAVRSGKALYVGISNWPLEPLKQAAAYLQAHDTPLLIYQGSTCSTSNPSKKAYSISAANKASASSLIRRWRRDCSPSVIWKAYRPTRAWRKTISCIPTTARRNCWTTCTNCRRKASSTDARSRKRHSHGYWRKKV